MAIKIDLFFYSRVNKYLQHNMKNSFQLLYDSDSDDEETVNAQTMKMRQLGRAFWEDQRRGNTMKWGDWCNDGEDGIYSEDECILLKPQTKRNKNVVCLCERCNFQRHSNPPNHFSDQDKAFCCSLCRITNGKKHGGHCQRAMR